MVKGIKNNKNNILYYPLMIMILVLHLLLSPINIPTLLSFSLLKSLQLLLPLLIRNRGRRITTATTIIIIVIITMEIMAYQEVVTKAIYIYIYGHNFFTKTGKKVAYEFNYSFMTK